MKSLYYLSNWRRTCHHAVIFLIWLSFSCQDKPIDPKVPENTPDSPIAPEKDAIPGTTKQAITIDQQYDLSNTHAASFIDSISMEYQNPSLLVSDSDTSVAFFLKNGTNEVMAVVRTIPKGGELVVNARTVTEGLYDLLPAYHSLRSEQQTEFETVVVQTDEYKSFLALVDERLKSKKPVYELDPSYLTELRKLNLFITRTYFKDVDGGSEGGGGRISGEPEDISSWLIQENNTIENQFYSYVDVFLSSATPGESRELLMEPRNYFLSATGHNISLFPDSYYSVRITQVTDQARQENLAGAVSKGVGMAVSVLIGVNVPGPGSCVGELIEALTGDLADLYTAGALNTTPEEDLSNLFNIAGNAFQTVVSEEKCYGQLFSKAVLSRINVFTYYWQIGWIASDAVQLGYLLKGLRNVKELSTDVQVYQGKLIMGQAAFAALGELKESYNAKEVVTVSVGTTTVPLESLLDRSLFKVEWVPDILSGTVSPALGQTDKDGQAKAQWTLPSEELPGGAQLVANIKDKEGDHLKGSPVTFDTKVSHSVSLTIVSGNNQSAPPTFSLPDPLVVEVKDNLGNPLGNIPVEWEVKLGGGRLLFASTITDGEGRSTNGWQLGQSGIQLVNAIVKKSDQSDVPGSPAAFSASLKEPETLVIVSGNDQAAQPDTQLSNPLVVLVKDKDGINMSGVVVNWRVTSGGGQLGSSTSLTDSHGQASNSWTLGPTGTQTVRASASRSDGTSLSGSPVEFSARHACPETLTVRVASTGLTATATASGGLPPYSYSWNNGSTKGNTYSDRSKTRNIEVTVTDANGCTATRNDICVGTAGNFVAKPCTDQSFKFYLDGNLVGTLAQGSKMNVIFSGSQSQRMVGTVTGVTHNYSSSVGYGQNCLEWFTCCPDAGTCTPNMCQ